LDEAHSVAAIMDELGLVGSSKIGIRLAHSYGDKLSRFGFTQNELDELDRDPLLRKLDIRGVHIHSGSNLSDIEGFTETFARHEPYIKSILSKSASWLDIGGGYPANSRRSDREFSCKQMLEEMARYLEGLLDLLLKQLSTWNQVAIYVKTPATW